MEDIVVTEFDSNVPRYGLAHVYRCVCISTCLSLSLRGFHLTKGIMIKYVEIISFSMTQSGPYARFMF